MLVRKIKLNNFMAHSSTDLALPDRGVVVVTGANGSGKSSLAEAIAVAGWGKSLRGSSCWVSGATCLAEIAIEVAGKEISISREASPKGRIRLTYAPQDAKYATTSKAQAALQSYIGDFDTWRRCSIFSSQDASHFTLSTDAERKRLLENLLGLDRFDVALDKCRKDKKGLIAIQLKCERKQLENATRISSAKNLASNVKSKLEGLQAKPVIKPVAASHRPLAEIEREQKTLQEGLRGIQNDGYALRDKVAALKSNIAHAQQRLRAVSVDSCPTCGQGIAESYAQKIRDTENATIKKNMKALALTQKTHKKTHASIEGMQDKLHGLSDELTDARLAIQAVRLEQEKENTIRDHLVSQLDGAREDVTSLEVARKKIARELDAVSFDLAILENVESVLGTKGVRAHILSSALGALELTSNKWLAEISNGEYSLRVTPYSEKKTGGHREAIAIHVDGIAGGNGYRGASGGQRRRIDVALLLGLAELAQASSQYNGGTIFFDEVFDSLDASGVAAVSKVIAQLGQRMPVIIISHSASLVDTLQADLHYHIEDGAIV